MHIMLNGSDWRLMGHWPYTPLMGRSMETGGELMGATEWIDATVPGSVQADLMRAGIIEDPYYADNSLRCEWVEHRWWRYQKRFAAPEGVRMERVTLEFMGVDYAAHFFFNGHRLGWHEGMFDPVRFDVAALLQPENRLDVVLESVPAENSQIGYTSESRTQKARFGYKWDFGTRLVNLGLWEDVRLNCTGPYRLDDVFLRSDVDDAGRGLVRVSGRVDGLMGRSDAVLSLTLEGADALLTAELKPDSRDGRFEHEFVVENPQLWQVNGMGGQHLYQMKMNVRDEKGVSDEWNGKIGIRRLRYRQNEGAPLDSLPYTIEINGSPVYLKGVNMTPLDHMYGTLRREDYERALFQAKNMGVNLIRIWGGGLTEKREFYELCDELGVLVWQEFIQSSSGLDNIPSKISSFLKLLETAARAALSTRRNYTCHAVWSGGNELMNAQGAPASTGDENLAMLANLCREYDPEKLFLPTSASGPNCWLRLDVPGVSYDIHGNWQYEGVPAHYERYNRSDCLLHSEFGCQGLSSVESLCTFLPPEHLRPVSMRDDLLWRHHGEWWDTYDRDAALFGPLNDLPRWTLLSQFVQAEAIRYILESNRRRKYRNSGSFVWQLNEPWPNAACTSLLEYNGTAKMAAYWVKKAYAPAALSARYDTLIFPAGAPMKLRLFLHNSLAAGEFTARVELFDLRGRSLASAGQTVVMEGNAVREVFALEAALPEVEQEIVLARLTVRGGDGSEVFRSHVILSQRTETPFAGLNNPPETAVRAALKDGALEIVNDGPAAALFVHPVSMDRRRPLLLEDSHLILLPGEAQRVAVSAAGELPPMRLRSLNAPETDVR